MTRKEMAYPPGMVLHGGTYRIQKRIPKDCLPHFAGKTVLYFKTGTADKKEAASKAWTWLADLDEQFQRIRTTGNPNKTTISDAELDYITGRLVWSVLDADQETRELDDEAFSRAAEELQQDDQETRQALAHGLYGQIKQIAQDWLNGHGYDIPEDAPEFLRVLSKFAKARAEAISARKLGNSGEAVDTPNPPPSPAQTTQEHGPTLTACFKK
jgi:uncharacterized protein DUF6538